MTYSEAMFCALAVWALIGVLERNWLLAGRGVRARGAGAPDGGGADRGRRRRGGPGDRATRGGWRPWVAVLLAPSGLIGYLAWVAGRTGDLFGWFRLQQEGWDSGFDGGGATIRYTVAALANASSVLEVATVGLIVAALALFGAMFRGKLPWPLIVYAAGVLIMDLGANGLFNSKARLMLPAFTLLLPLAIGMARRRPGHARRDAHRVRPRGLLVRRLCDHGLALCDLSRPRACTR